VLVMHVRIVCAARVLSLVRAARGMPTKKLKKKQREDLTQHTHDAYRYTGTLPSR